LSKSEKEKEKKEQYGVPFEKIKRYPPPEPLRTTRPERMFVEEIKREPPPEPTRRIKPKEEKKGEN